MHILCCVIVAQDGLFSSQTEDILRKLEGDILSSKAPLDKSAKSREFEKAGLLGSDPTNLLSFYFYVSLSFVSRSRECRFRDIDFYSWVTDSIFCRG